jgi:tetratricopeptide (TPR) repeat protein
VHLTLAKDSDEQINAIMKQIRIETEEGLTGWSRVHKLLFRLDEFNKTEQVYDKLLDLESDDYAKGQYYFQLGSVTNKFDNDFDVTACNQLGDYSVALLYLQKSLEIMQIDLPQDHSNLALCYNNISGVCV